MLDGLGLVYEKQGNTGAAAYTPPSNTDPFAVVTNDLASQVDFQRKKKERDAIKQEELNNKIIEAINPEGWSLDNRQYFYKSGNDLKLEATLLKAKGKNLNDISDPEVMAFMDKSKRVLNEASLSAEQGKLFDVMYNEFSKNPNKYDKEATALNVEKWRSLPMEERFKTDPRSLFAPKYNKFAAAEPIKSFDKFADISPKGGTRINKAKIDQYLNEIASDQEVIDSYQQGLERGDWSNPQEWKQSQAQFIESQIQNKADAYQKPEKVDKDGGLGFEEIMMQFDMNNKTHTKAINNFWEIVWDMEDKERAERNKLRWIELNDEVIKGWIDEDDVCHRIVKQTIECIDVNSLEELHNITKENEGKIVFGTNVRYEGIDGWIEIYDDYRE
jgi:hypothetical protein